jgi:hypothetical protein
VVSRGTVDQSLSLLAWLRACNRERPRRASDEAHMTPGRGYPSEREAGSRGRWRAGGSARTALGGLALHLVGLRDTWGMTFTRRQLPGQSSSSTSAIIVTHW